MKSLSFTPHSKHRLESSSEAALEMFALSLELSEEPARQQGTRFDEYEILGDLDAGASAVVSRARHAGLQRTVALKRLHVTWNEREVERFRNSAAAAAQLEHPNIVPIFHVGEPDEPPFFTMRLIEGGTLQQAMPRLLEAKKFPTQMLAKVARAVHFAHQRGVLHRDLKPANILLDENDEPYVADFGLAKRLDAQALASRSSAIVGTLGYMSPEQARGVTALSVAADIYALGVILYEMLTEQLPLPPGSMLGQLTWLTSPTPPLLPRTLKPHVDRNLEIICLKCLHKEPEKRYQTADELAQALDRAGDPNAEDEPLPPLSQRLEAWLRRHPRRSLASASLLAVLVVGLLAGWWLWRQDQRVYSDTLETNTFIAGSQAGAALAQLREYAERVAQAAQDPEVVKILVNGAIVEPALPLRARLGSFDNLSLLKNDGFIIAQWPRPHPVPVPYQRNYAFRDYFRGARDLAEQHLPGAYLARAYRSESQGQLVFAFSAPVRDERGVALGVLAATLNAKSVFGAVKMQDSAGGLRVTSALLGPRGPDRGEKSGVPHSDFTFLVHPGLPDGREYRLGGAFSTELQRTFGASAPPGQQFSLAYVPPVKVREYEDIVPGFEGKWLAAFAPVGNTGFAVLVQTRRQATLNWPGVLGR